MITNILTAVVTSYLATGHPCADGHYPLSHHTIALPRCFPLGSEVIINGQYYLGEDRTNKRFDGRFDIFVDSKYTALNWGKQTLCVTVITK